MNVEKSSDNEQSELKNDYLPDFAPICAKESCKIA
jgi:hypothetical protein